MHPKEENNKLLSLNFQNFGWKIRVLSPGENGSTSRFRRQDMLQMVFLVTTVLYLNSH